MSASRIPSSAARGYGWAHQVLRRSWARRVALAWSTALVGGLPIEAGQAWDLGHDDVDRRRYVDPEYARSAHCPAGGNRATARHRVEREGRRAPVDLDHSRIW